MEIAEKDNPSKEENRNFRRAAFECKCISARNAVPLVQAIKKALRMARKCEYPLSDLLRLVRYAAIVAALQQNHGSTVRAAKMLGVHRNVIAA